MLRVPHPSFLRWTKTHLFSDPVKAAIVDEREIPLLSFTDLEVMVRQEEGPDPDCLVATGVRAEDGPIRMMALRKYGPITLSKKKWHPIWDWSKTEVVDAIEHRSAEQLALVVVEALLDERQAGPLSERVRNA